MSMVERMSPVEIDQPRQGAGTLAVLTKSEIDQQITTAKAYPRSIKGFHNAALELTTLSEKVANECLYALPRDGKVIEGPSARLAEILAHAWGNCRAGARIVEETHEFVTAQGVFHDLETNTVITYESKRRITNKSGKRFNADMIATTANAACSIALRNAILKGVPKALWSDIYDAARTVAKGDAKTLANKRADAIKAFAAYGVSTERILQTLDVPSVEDLGLDQLLVLRGIFTAIKDGETTPEEAFPVKKAEAIPAGEAPRTLADFGKATPKATEAAPAGDAETVDPETGEVLDAASGPQDAIAAANERGRAAKLKGMSIRALPPEYREPGRDAEANAWKDGWNSQQAEDGTP